MHKTEPSTPAYSFHPYGAYGWVIGLCSLLIFVLLYIGITLAKAENISDLPVILVLMLVLTFFIVLPTFALRCKVTLTREGICLKHDGFCKEQREPWDHFPAAYITCDRHGQQWLILSKTKLDPKERRKMANAKGFGLTCHVKEDLVIFLSPKDINHIKTLLAGVLPCHE